MTNVGPGAVYGAFLLIGLPLLVAPIGVTSYLLAGRLGGFHRSLGSVLGGSAGAGVLAVLITGEFDVARVLGTLSVLYVGLPLGIALAALRLLTEDAPAEVARRATAGWAIAHAALLLSIVLTRGVPLRAIGGAPSVGGMAFLTGYVGLMAIVGVLAGAIGVGLSRRTGGGEPTDES